MANISKSVEIIFGGKNDLEKTIRDISHSFDKFETAIMGVAEPLAKMGDAVLKVDAALAIFAAGGIALATKAAGEFSDQVAEISSLITDPGFDVSKFGDDLLNYSRDSSMAIKDINEAIYQAISLGVDYQDSLKLINQAEELAVAGKADLKNTTELLRGSLNAYGGTMEDVAKFSDVFFQTVRDGKTTIPELAAELSKVTSVAANAKVPIEGLMAALAALTATGMDTAEATTALRGIITSISTPTPAAAEAANKLGIAFGSAALNAKGLDKILKEVYVATGGNAEQIRDLIPEMRAFNGALILGADLSGKYAQAMINMQNAAGATEIAYQKMADNFKLINQNLINNIQATLAEIGKPLLGDYAKIAEGIKALFKGFDIAFDKGAFEPLYAMLEEFSTTTVELLKKIGEALPEALKDLDYSGLISSLKELSSVFFSFLDGLDPTKPEDLHIAFQKVIDTIESLIRVTSGIASFFKEIYVEVQKAVDAFNNMDASSQKAFGNVLGAAQFVVQAGTKIALAILAIKESGIDLEIALQVVAGSIKVTFNTIQLAFNANSYIIITTIELILRQLDMLTLGLSETIEKNLNEIDKLQEKLGKNALQNAQDMTDGFKIISQGYGDLKSASEDAAKSEIKDLKNVEKAAQSNEEYWKEYLNNQLYTHDTISSKSQESSSKIVKSFEKVSESTKKTKDDLEKIPKSIQVELEYRKSDLAQFEAETKRIDSLLDFEATIKTKQFEYDIKSLEALSEGLKANFESISEVFKDTGTQITELLKLYASYDGSYKKERIIEDQIKKENQRREEALQQQKDLTKLQKEQLEAQIKLLRAKEERIRSGEALIRVEAEGLKPHLEAIWMEIMEEIQIKGTEEGIDFLIGI